MPSSYVPKSESFFEGFLPYEARTEIFQEKGSPKFPSEITWPLMVMGFFGMSFSLKLI